MSKHSGHKEGDVLIQQKRRDIYDYKTYVNDDGQTRNNSTLYVITGVAHPHQVSWVFRRAVEQLEVECDVNVNIVRKRSGEYMGYAFVDVTNPAVFDAILNDNVKLPVIDLDESQMLHQQHTTCTLSCSAAFVFMPKDDVNDRKLFVTNVPARDVSFLYAIFARYARVGSDVNVSIRASKNKLHAIVSYSNPHDAAFALVMLKRINAKYKGEDVIMTSRYSHAIKGGKKRRNY